MPWNKETWSSTGITLKVALLQTSLLQREAAELLGINLTSFNMKLLGRRKFTDDEKNRLSQILGKPLPELFPDTENNGSEENTQERVA